MCYFHSSLYLSERPNFYFHHFPFILTPVPFTYLLYSFNLHLLLMAMVVVVMLFMVVAVDGDDDHDLWGGLMEYWWWWLLASDYGGCHGNGGVGV